MSENPLIALSHRYYREGEGTTKPDHYFKLYHEMLCGLRDKPINFLELGVSSGASMLVWHDYFSKARIVGLEFEAQPPAISEILKGDRAHFVRGDQSSPATLQDAADLTHGEGFDVIIDDASHIADWSRRSFDFLFNKALKPGGLYFIEDFGTGYIDGFPGGHAFSRDPGIESEAGFQSIFPSHQYGMVGWIKQLFDELHAAAIIPGEPVRYAMEYFKILPHIMVIKKPG
ncbi:hypothetical protein OKW40_004054 [Paraburkholderia sp. RAU6.4a]|uniref:hypothetical protein n=1 Tax=Paraburkholderia sp. RAU6.4a TaxID=2991067 RepID=UPI003D211DBB